MPYDFIHKKEKKIVFGDIPKLNKGECLQQLQSAY